MKRVIIIHGWGGSPEEGWFPWLKAELIARGYEVIVPAMPNSNWPKIEEWVPYLSEQIGVPTTDTSFVGHSIGCQTILRYLQTLPGGHVDQVVMVAPWMTLTSAALEETEDSRAIATPWIETPIEWTKVRPRAKKFTTVLSETDPFVPLAEAKFFQGYLGAESIILPGPGHLGGEDGMIKFPTVLERLVHSETK